jgi:hemerythrin
MVTWKESYSIGNKMIDEQHKKLFELCDKIVELHHDEFVIDKYDRIVVLISELRDYTSFHFHQEEAYMLKINYAGYEDQKVDHENFIKKLLDVNLRDIDENQDEYIESLLVFVLEWICDHIVKKDKLIK